KGEVTLSNLVSKAGRCYGATVCLYLEYTEDGTPISGEVKFKERSPNEGITSLKCPSCGKLLRKTDWGFACSGRKDGCHFSIGEICGHTFTEEEAAALLSDGTTGLLKGLRSKKGES